MRGLIPFLRRRAVLCLVLVAPLLVHLPELVTGLSSDPLPMISGLGLTGADWHAGIVPGRPGWIDGNAGATVQALGRRVACDWWHGEVPWWNPYDGVGMPLAGEYQPAAFFMPFVLLLGLDNGLLWLKIALQTLAGVSMLCLLRRLRLSQPACLAGALAYGFNGTFAWASDSPIQPLPFLPLILLGIEHARERGLAILALGVGGLLLAGFPETAFLLGLLAVGWAVVRMFDAQDTTARIGFVRRVVIGGVAGCALAAPQLVAFAAYLPEAILGQHGGMIDRPLPRSGWSMLLMPAINGPIFFADQTSLWFQLGGYAGVVLLTLALIGVWVTPDRRLSRWLVAFIALMVCKIGDVRPVSRLLDLLPAFGHAMVFRYGVPAVLCALTVLAAFAIDGVSRAPARTRWRLCVACGTLVAVLATIAVWQDRATMGVVLAQPGGYAFVIGAIVWGATGLGAVMVAVGNGWSRLCAGVLAVDAVVLFCIPLLGVRPADPIDQGLVAFLHARLRPGERVVSMGPLGPNYGAYFAIPSLNHITAPAPRRWIEALRRDIDPVLDEVTFNGTLPFDISGDYSLTRVVAAAPERLTALGVRFVLAWKGAPVPGIRPLGAREVGGTPMLDLSPTGHVTEIVLPPGSLPTVTLGQLSLRRGGGATEGQLHAALCDEATCGSGEASLAGTGEGGQISITLPDRFAVPASERPVRLRLWLTGASGTLSLYQRVTAAGASVPDLLAFRADAPRVVYDGPRGVAYELPRVAPYFEAGDACRVRMIDRANVEATCRDASVLLRRELMMTGWQARVNGRRVTPGTDGLFQRVPLPRGTSVVRFRYVPPYARLGWALACGGVVTLMVGAVSDLRRRTEKRMPQAWPHP
ncbi:hypothetical protein AA103196_1920 [Ameyamaea chiangmaiensis NBRC 103196]|uniref:YfhO family protein n=1 Tax=Ameyamaea chiangmaiensis TaxID=442969 RepID=A0A850P923_9PROT|nr:hypothetical protein [Ameyamaea chiangmaiensis]MBS4073815.1 hypothetical protein [Ameyamaea chiangmaiensis]NVN39189.1 hypothetical protein [Ameyamaea chiangmaiensis]GBQ68326.1 hypothetical protein AA103196_1920 [Ameyamaea chiangmaiensis NBRC 103196]